MSYGLHIWHQPVPEDFADAELILSRLQDNASSSSEAHVRFLEAARRLEARFPFTQDDEKESDDVWSDGPLAPYDSSSLWGVGIKSQHSGLVLEFVIAVAGDLELVVYDMQVGKTFLPDGKVFSYSDTRVGDSSSASMHSGLALKPWWKIW